ncbi:hypothetical protein JFL43_13550 [Viridibacillus sp. YIM B01967]|uniref:Transposase n=1 Tax=Viridibacillus soli TaxID=2798301 RepID=A0ABS1H8X0_9BACL|nr:hypothetical protein [Viridibacillus soli]MBK3495864.1 hypothetical protein [Viridibacillus soli]
MMSYPVSAQMELVENKKGKTVSVVHMKMIMEHPLTPNIYDYLVKE